MKNGQTNRRNYTNLKRNLAIMVMYVPVKFEFDWTNCFRVRLWKRKCGQRDEQTDKKRTNKQTELHQSRKENLAIIVMYVPVKFEFDWTNRFQVRVRKRKCGRTDGWTDKPTTIGQMNRRNYTNLERNLGIMVIYVPVKFEFDWTNRF